MSKAAGDLQLESLHSHTVRSDGNQNYQQVLETAEKNGIGTIAFTDHDIALDKPSLDFLRSYKGPVRWISGIEISSNVPLDNDHQDAGTLHILGLFINPFEERLQEYTQQLADSRFRRMREYVKHLRNIGFKVDESDCLEAAGESPVGSPHIVNAVKKYPQNETLIDRLHKQLEADAERNEHSRELMQRLEAYGQQQLPYVLFMKKDSFYPFRNNDKNKVILDLDETVKLIHGAGGIAILAHWYFNKKDLPADTLEKLLKENRLDGLELAVENAISEHDHSDDVEYLRRLADTYDVATTVGSDSHDGKDIEFFAGTQNAQDAMGQTRQLTEKFDVSLTWTNYETT